MRGRPQSAPGLETWSHPGETAEVTSWGRHVAVMSGVAGRTHGGHMGGDAVATPFGEKHKGHVPEGGKHPGQTQDHPRRRLGGNRLLLQTLVRVFTDCPLTPSARTSTAARSHPSP